MFSISTKICQLCTKPFLDSGKGYDFCVRCRAEKQDNIRMPRDKKVPYGTSRGVLCQIANLYFIGKSTNEISKILKLSIPTIYCYCSAILDNFGFRSIKTLMEVREKHFELSEFTQSVIELRKSHEVGTDRKTETLHRASR